MARRATSIREIRAGRDVFLGDQINQTDLTRVEALLEQVVALLRQAQATVRVERDAGQSAVVVSGADGEARVAAADVLLLGALLRQADPRRCEEIYLARFILGETYARWERAYVPLAGLLTPPLRLSDRNDPGISAAGETLRDVRQALTEFRKRRLVILGEPGAGKTTTLHRLALDLARDRLRDPLHTPLPFRADLCRFTADVQPSDFLKAEWETCGLAQSYGQAVAQGQVCFLLDGVNQMPYADRARRVERWAHWAEELPDGNWAVFTCRTADYVTGLRLPEVRVQSLDEPRMRQYFELRFDPPRAAVLWRDFEQRLHAGDDRFEQLARNPFMLAQLAERCAEGRPFTGSRTDLMDDLARRLIERELEQERQPPALTADPAGTLAAEMDALSRLAYWMQARGEGTVLPRAAAARLALGAKGQLRLSLDEVLGLALDATVLEVVEGQGETAIYAFYHHLLQEYFAARELLRRFRSGQRLGRRWRVPWRGWQFVPRPLRPGEQLAPPPVTGWEETVIMAAGLAGRDAPRFVAAVRRGNLPLAGRCLAEAGAARDDLAPLAEATRAALLARQRSPRAHLRARIDAGLALGELGHPELAPRPFAFEERTVWAIVPPLQLVPAGEFLRGSERGDRQAYRDEYTSERRVALPAFAIGRYPVTNAEYACFVEDGGYRDDRWWSEAGQAWKRGGPEAHAAAIEDWLGFVAFLRENDLREIARRLNWPPWRLNYWKEVVQLSDDDLRERARRTFERPFDRPAFWDDRALSSPARPVVGVNVHEAEAYCAWLAALFQVSGFRLQVWHNGNLKPETLQPETIRLPTEAEWEKAARGVDGRQYPWGDAFDVARANTVESHIYTTTPVGLYPDGVSPYGLFDAAGNVWEWTADEYAMYPGGEPSDDFGKGLRVVRGGSWLYDRNFARCAYRSRYTPGNFYGSIGFRVVAPGSISGF